ncbi:hypothetical protein ACFFTN_26280, partial [Aminobacter aganoensis]|uniref:hypothetical protein n=1 Tax=Aminobacter aganoensis TaxID=83264 RepID=UPI0035EA267B
SDDDSVGRTSAGDCEQSRSGAEKKALNVHFLTSSQNRDRKPKNGRTSEHDSAAIAGRFDASD